MALQTYQGGCRCGVIHFQLQKHKIKLAACGCKDCQRSSGAPFCLNVGVKKEHFQITQGEGSLRFYADNGDSGNDVLRYFCEICGSPLYAIPTGHPNLISVRAQALENIEVPEPVFVIYQHNIPDWIGFPEHSIEKGKQFGG